MKPQQIQHIVVVSLWVAAMGVATYLLRERVERGGISGWLALGICGLMWTIFLVRVLVGNKRGAGAEQRANRWLVLCLLGLTLVALVVLLINCLVHGQYIGAGVALLFVVVVGQASQVILKRAR